MSPIIEDTSPASMARCIEDNMAACFSLLAAPRNGVHEDNGITTIVTGVPTSDFNGVFRTQLPDDLPPDQLDARIAATLRELDGSGVPYAWYVFPSSRPAALTEHLRAHGLCLGAVSPGMAADLQALNESAPPPQGLAIELVRDIPALRTWMRASFTGFGMPAELQDSFAMLLEHFDLSAAAPTQLYLGWLNGQPVATSLVIMAEGIAGLYNIATLSEYRGQGIGAAMTLAPLREARARGYRVGILEASEAGFRVYQRLGFQQYITIEQHERADAAS